MRAWTAWDLCFATLLLASLLSLCEGVHWSLDLASHFRPHLMDLWLLVGLIEGIRRARARALMAIAWVVVFAWSTLAPSPPRASAHPHMSLTQVNVQMDAADTRALVEYLQAEKPDVVSLVEVDAAWIDVLRRRLDYPYIEAAPREDFLGLGLLSRFPILSYEVEEFAPGIPVATALLDVRGKEVTLTTVHALPPITAAWASSQAQTLAALWERPSPEGKRWIVCGDFNATPWSAVFQELEGRSSLRPVPHGGRWGGTWPAPWPWRRLPIDHCLLDEGLGLVGFDWGPALGGDHRPLNVSVGLAQDPP